MQVERLKHIGILALIEDALFGVERHILPVQTQDVSDQISHARSQPFAHVVVLDVAFVYKQAHAGVGFGPGASAVHLPGLCVCHERNEPLLHLEKQLNKGHKPGRVRAEARKLNVGALRYGDPLARSKGLVRRLPPDHIFEKPERHVLQCAVVDHLVVKRVSPCRKVFDLLREAGSHRLVRFAENVNPGNGLVSMGVYLRNGLSSHLAESGIHRQCFKPPFAVPEHVAFEKLNFF